METFFEWLSNLDLNTRLWLLFVEHDLKPAEYDALFEAEFERLLPRISDPAERNRLRGVLGKNHQWTNYIAAALRNAGFRDQVNLQEKVHDLIVRLLVSPGGLFRDYDPTRHGPFDLRWKRSVANACKNLAEKERNRRRLVPSISISQEFRPGGVTDVADHAAGGQDDERLFDDFRQLVQSRLGQIGTAILNARLAGQETKSLVGRPDLGSPGRFVIKRVVQELKALAREFAEKRGNPAFLRDVVRAMERESETVAKRRTTTAARRVG